MKKLAIRYRLVCLYLLFFIKLPNAFALECSVTSVVRLPLSAYDVVEGQVIDVPVTRSDAYQKLNHWCDGKCSEDELDQYYRAYIFLAGGIKFQIQRTENGMRLSNIKVLEFKEHYFPRFSEGSRYILFLKKFDGRFTFDPCLVVPLSANTTPESYFFSETPGFIQHYFFGDD